MNLETRTAQVLEVTDEMRDEGDDSNPIIFAEQGPNHFYILTHFFPEGDGVKVEEDLDLNSIEIQYFNDEKTIVLEDGPLYDWAMNLYKGHN